MCCFIALVVQDLLRIIMMLFMTGNYVILEIYDILGKICVRIILTFDLLISVQAPGLSEVCV